MAESIEHISYVYKMVEYSNTFNGLVHSLLYADLPEFKSRTPKVIGGFYPDLYYKDAYRIIIGEAKTSEDIENDHTLSQIDSYIEEVRTAGGERHILLCTSVMAFALFKNMILRKKRKEGLDDIHFHVMDNHFKRVVL